MASRFDQPDHNPADDSFTPRNRDCISCGAEVPDSWGTIGSVWCNECWNHAVEIQDRKIDAELRKVAR